MFTFIKKLFGFDQETMKAAGVQTEQAPYKVEQPIPAQDVVPQPIIAEGAGIVDLAIAQQTAPTPVNPQITDAVTQAPAKKPRAPKAQSAKKAAPVKKAAAMKAAPKKPRSKKV